MDSLDGHDGEFGKKCSGAESAQAIYTAALFTAWTTDVGRELLLKPLGIDPEGYASFLEFTAHMLCNDPGTRNPPILHAHSLTLRYLILDAQEEFPGRAELKYKWR